MMKTWQYQVLCLRGTGALALLLATAATTVLADGLDEVREFRIEAQPLDAALIEFSEQADLQIIVPTELVAGVQSSGVTGEYAGNVAVAALLDSVDLTFHAVKPATGNTVSFSTRNISISSPILLGGRELSLVFVSFLLESPCLTTLMHSAWKSSPIAIPPC